MIKHEELFRHRNGLCGKDCPTLKPELSKHKCKGKDCCGSTGNLEPEKEEGKCGCWYTADVVMKYPPYPELLDEKGRCKHGVHVCPRQTKCPFCLPPQETCDCWRTGESCKDCPPQDEDWEEELTKIMDEWRMHETANTCSVCDSPQGHTTIKSFIQSLINKERVKAYAEEAIKCHEHTEQARQDAFKECIERLKEIPETDHHGSDQYDAGLESMKESAISAINSLSQKSHE